MINKYVYVAVGQKYMDEAEVSARSLKKHTKNQICLISDKYPLTNLWDHVILITDPDYSIEDKLKMIMCECDKAIYLDSDTYICEGIDDIFDLLNRFDLVARQDWMERQYKLSGIPESFPELNTGVIGFRKTEKVKHFFTLWLKYFKEYKSIMGREMDQRSFRKAIFESDLDFFVLPPEYNLMNSTMGVVRGHVRVLHGRENNELKSIENKINQKPGNFKVFIPEIGIIYLISEMEIKKLIALIMQLSVLTLRELLNRMRNKFKF